MPDLQVTVEASVISADRVAASFVYTGTHDGTYLGVQPTHRKLRFTSCDIFAVKNGLLSEHWAWATSRVFSLNCAESKRYRSRPERAMQSEAVTRRDLLSLVGSVAGSAAMYHAMTSLGFAAESGYRGPIKLDGDPKGASVLILGAGLAGMTAALELRKAGYKVQLLEFNSRPGGRNWTLRGGDKFTELGGATQACEFDEGLYLNPGPWRIPYHHHAVLDYCKRLGVALEPFIQLNYNALLHSTEAFGGRPQRIRDIKTDFQGHVAELLAKATQQSKLDEAVTAEDREILLQALRSWGALDRDYSYKASLIAADIRGYARDPGGGLGGGLGAAPVAGEPVGLSEILKSRLWRYLQNFALYQFQTTMFQPVGGMDMIGKAFAGEVGDLIQYDAKVTRIQQDDAGVTISHVNSKTPEAPQLAKAEWCICTIPLSVLSQIPIDVGSRMKAAIDAVPYAASVKIGLQFKRRFWEEDEAIYGGISYTDLPIRQISYPSTGFNRTGRGVLLGAYLYEGANAFEFTSMVPAERVARAVDFGSRIHSQYKAEFENGVAVACTGCRSRWAVPESGPTGTGRSITTICARSTAGLFWRASTPPTSRRGKRARSCRRSMPSRDCISVWSGPDAMISGRIGAGRWKYPVAVLLAAVFALSAPAAAPSENEGTASLQAPLSPGFRFTESSGEQLFAGVCQGCHMPDGKGAAGAANYPSLAGDNNLEARGYPVYVVVRGQRAMPPIGRMMSDDQVAAVVNYVRTHFGNQYRDAVTADEVRLVRP